MLFFDFDWVFGLLIIGIVVKYIIWDRKQPDTILQNKLHDLWELCRTCKDRKDSKEAYEKIGFIADDPGYDSTDRRLILRGYELMKNNKPTEWARIDPTLIDRLIKKMKLFDKGLHEQEISKFLEMIDDVLED